MALSKGARSPPLDHGRIQEVADLLMRGCGAPDAADTINDVIGFAPERDDLSGCHTGGGARQPSAESAIWVV